MPITVNDLVGLKLPRWSRRSHARHRASDVMSTTKGVVIVVLWNLERGSAMEMYAGNGGMSPTRLVSAHAV